MSLLDLSEPQVFISGMGDDGYFLVIPGNCRYNINGSSLIDFHHAYHTKDFGVWDLRPYT